MPFPKLFVKKSLIPSMRLFFLKTISINDDCEQSMQRTLATLTVSKARILSFFYRNITIYRNICGIISCKSQNIEHLGTASQIQGHRYYRLR